MPGFQIVGFSSNDRTPGYYGETVYGAGAVSASSIPLVLLLVGTMLTGSTGTATPNQDVVAITSQDDADAAFVAGAEISRMCYAALRVPGVKLYAAPVGEAGGAAGGVQVITFGGTWSVVGTYSNRINGEVISATVQSSDTSATFATAYAAVLNQDPRRPYTAAASGSQVIITTKSKGARQSAYVTFQDTTLAPSGMTAVISGSTWTLTTAKTTSAPISFAVPVTANGYYYKCTVAGTTAGVEPTWPTTIGATVVDGTVTWTCWGKVLTGGATTMGGASGTESAASLLTVLTPSSFDRIACSEVDSTNLARWRDFLNSQAGSTSGVLEHFMSGVNDTARPTSLATTTMNNQRMALHWTENGETAAWENSAYLMALRCATEQSDPAASSVYDDAVVLGAAPQSQAADRPSHTVKQAAINEGITVLYTDASGSNLLVLRGVTTHTLTGTTPDYRTLDWSDAYVPDFVRRDLGVFWTTLFKPNNPRVMDDPSGDQKPLPSGIATPTTWNAAVEGKLRNYEKGILATSSAPTAQQVAPIIIDVDNNKPTTVYDPIAKRLMSIVPVVPAPGNHQIGVSVRQVTSS